MYAAYLKDIAYDGTLRRCTGYEALISLTLESSACHFTVKWCCNRHQGSGFDWNHFFRGPLLYEDLETSQLYYGSADDPDREEVILPLRNKRKAGKKTRATSQRQPLISRLLAWRARIHSLDSLASVRPAYFIIDDEGIKTLARLHPSDVTSPGQVVDALSETQEWKVLWSASVLRVIEAYDRELTERRNAEGAQQKARQKRTKQEQDLAKFNEVSNETAEKIRQDVLRRHAARVAALARKP